MFVSNPMYSLDYIHNIRNRLGSQCGYMNTYMDTLTAWSLRYTLMNVEEKAAEWLDRDIGDVVYREATPIKR